MKKSISNKGIKRAASPMVDVSGSETKKRSRKQVDISDDIWLVALKFLTGQRCSKMQMISRQLNGVVYRNVSRLPLVIVESAAIRLKERKKTEFKMIASDSTILPDEKWFKDRDIAFDVPAGIQLNNAIIGVELEEDSCAELCVLGPAQKKKLTSYEKTRPWFSGQKFKSSVIFYAKFSPHRNSYSWASMTFFLKLLYDPSIYVKELSMYALDKKLKAISFAGEEKCYIRCGSFALQVSLSFTVEELCDSVSWLEQNVQADIIQFPEGILYDDSEIYDAMSNYLLSSSWISVSQVVKLGYVDDLVNFFGILIKKFRTVATVQSVFPTILFSGSRLLLHDPLAKLLSEKNTLEERSKLDDAEDNDELETDQESENSDDTDDSENDDEAGFLVRPLVRFQPEQTEETYTISNGPNRMRIEFVRQPSDHRWSCCVRMPYEYDIRVTVEANE